MGQLNSRRQSIRQKCLHLKALAFLLACGTSAIAQQPASSGTTAIQLPLSGRPQAGVNVHQNAPVPAGTSANVQVQIQGAYPGSVVGTDVIPESFDLTLADAIQRGLRTNLGIISSAISLQHIQAQRSEARSRLLPDINVSASENAAKINLAAEGFSASAFGNPALQFPTTVGPFHYYDLHASLQQSLLDVTAIRNLRTQERTSEAAVLHSRQDREEVVLAVTGVYLQLMADLALVERQRAEMAYAEETYKQARAQADVGNKAPIEASRSLVEFQTERQRLRSQLGEVEKRRIQLARLIGLPLGTQMQPKEHLEPLVAEMPSLQDVVQYAWSQRLDLKEAAALLQSAEEARKAASAQRLPSASISGTYGLQGVNPNQGSPVFQVSAALSLPIFQGGRIEADTASADAVVKQRRVELADQQSSVESDVRNAYIDLQVANDQVTLAVGSTILLPQFLQNSLGYTAALAGLALSPGGIALAVMMPIAGILARKLDPRVIIAIGFALTAAGLFHVTGIYYGIDFGTLVSYRVIQVIGIPLIVIPISTLNYVGVPREKFNQVSGISNFTRNVGGAIGVSLLSNFINATATDSAHQSHCAHE
jgi:outer membrane protein TolC